MIRRTKGKARKSADFSPPLHSLWNGGTLSGMFKTGIFVMGIAVAMASAPTDTIKWSGSRISPVHQIPLKDEFNQPIIPTESNPLPFSTRFSCAPCHDYNVIKGGRHFNALTGAAAGRPGEPWIWLDERTGTQIPLSYRPWKGLWNPRDVGLSTWDFTLLFGRHFPGGGPAEPNDEETGPESRWNVSGKVEINCLGCHNVSRKQNPSEWAKQILRQNFRWAGTAAAGLGEVAGMASRLKPTWDVFDGPNRDDSEWAVAPSVKYDRTLFDAKHRAFLDLSYKPDDARCLACHSAAPVGRAKRDFDDDVHSAFGLPCADCHRHDVGHDMIRGYEGEDRDNPTAAGGDFTCRGCHLGGSTAAGKAVTPGRMGAPRPTHKGLPDVHFKRLACTVCHSGPLPAGELTRVRTAMANRLGIFGVADWSTPLPAVLEPVYIRDADHRLTPNRLMWPAFWARVEGEKVQPLKPEEVAAAAGDILFPEKPAVAVLTALSGVPDLGGAPVLVLDGRVFELNADGGLTGSGDSDGSGSAKIRGLKKVAPVVAWAIKKEGAIVPLLPDFNPAEADASVEPEIKIQNILIALSTRPGASGGTTIAVKGFVYRLVEGALDKAEIKDAPAPEPGIYESQGEERRPLLSSSNARIMDVLAGTDRTLTEEQVEAILRALPAKAVPDSRTGAPPEFAYISGGKLFRLDKKGTLAAEDHAAAAPATWPLAHQVRPARQALGVNGCTDCHSGGSDFFFAKIKGAGPLLTDKVMASSAVSFMGMTKPFHKLFGLSFLIRPGFKIVLGIAAFFIASLLLILFLMTLGRAAGLIDKRK